MNLEIAIFVTTFALLGARLLLSDRTGLRGAAAREGGKDAELDALMRPVLLFTTTARVAHC